MLASLSPDVPVYCVHRQRIAAAAREFLDGFPGRTLFAVKANNEVAVLDELVSAGIGHFDCASFDEIDLIASRYPDATCYFMSPVRLPGAAREAYEEHGVRHFMVDDLAGLPSLLEEIDANKCVIFALSLIHI